MLEEINSWTIEKRELHDYGNRLENGLYCQLRNNCSNLNAYLLLHYLEDLLWFWMGRSQTLFMHCAKYHSQREKLFHYMNINAIPVNINNILYGCEETQQRKPSIF